MKILPASLFEKFPSNGNWRIYLDENPWNCDCNFFEMKQLIEKQPKNFVNYMHLMCHTPAVHSNRYIVDVSIKRCDNDKTILEKCRKHNDDDLVNIPEEPAIKFRQFNDHSVEVDIELASNDYELLWFSSNESRCDSLDILDGQTFCAHEFRSTVNISNLSSDNTYMFCAIQKFSNAISPFDCAPFYVKSMQAPLPQDRSEGDNSYFVIVIVFVILLVCALLFGILFGVCLAKRYPTFIRSTSSRVVIQQLNHNEIWRKTERFSKENNQTTRTLYRSVSDASVASSRSYVTAVAPSPFEMLHWRKVSKNKNYLDTIMMDKSSPPPLPKRMHRLCQKRIYEQQCHDCTRECGREVVTKNQNNVESTSV